MKVGEGLCLTVVEEQSSAPCHCNWKFGLLLRVNPASVMKGIATERAKKLSKYDQL